MRPADEAHRIRDAGVETVVTHCPLDELGLGLRVGGQPATITPAEDHRMPEGTVQRGKILFGQRVEADELADERNGFWARDGHPTSLAYPTRSWRTTMASRPGPTPIAEMREPLIASSAST